jgi:prolyl oligopeptidase
MLHCDTRVRQHAEEHQMQRRKPLTALFAGVLLMPVSTYAEAPRAMEKPVIEEHFGTRVSDPYRYFEDVSHPEVASWMKAQSNYARESLDAIPGREALLQRLIALQGQRAATVAEVIERPGERFFYLKRGIGQNVFKLYLREGFEGDDRVLVDPEALQAATGVPHAVNYFVPSWDGRYLAYGISAGGSEDASLYVMDVASGKQVGEPITRVLDGVSWTPDSSRVAFNRLKELTPDMPSTERYLDSVVYLLELGQPASAAGPVFSRALLPGLELRRLDNATLVFQPGSEFVVAVANDTTERDDNLFVLPLAELGKDNAPWVRIASTSDEIEQVGLHGHHLYLYTHAGAPRFRIARLDLREPVLAKAVDVIPQQQGVIAGFSLGHDALYVKLRNPFGTELARASYEGFALEPIKLPVEGTVAIYGDNALLRDGVIVYATSWADAPGVLAWDSKTGKARDTGLAEHGDISSLPDVVVERVMVPSHDGVKVPMTVLYRKGLKRDGQRPAIVYGYGSYGISSDPNFNVTLYAWLEQDAVTAIAGIRGGGELGSEWREAGTGANKPNTWKDGIACAEYLVAEGFTSPSRLSIRGGSAGGIFAGRAITERPDLFRAGVIQVGSTDTLRSEFSANGITNISEFGTVTDPQGFRNLLAMSTYQNIVDGVRYPAVIFVHGINDPRVDVWHSLKTAARFQKATASECPVLLRLDDQAGHGIGNTVSQNLQETADVYAFLLWQMGVPGYQPGR